MPFLPLLSRGRRSGRAAALPTSKETVVRILVVDPDADNRDSWSLLLSCWGHQARVAADAPSALEQCQAFRPQAVLTEIILPGADGWQLARRLRAGCTLLVAITGYSRWDGP